MTMKEPRSKGLKEYRSKGARTRTAPKTKAETKASSPQAAWKESGARSQEDKPAGAPPAPRGPGRPTKLTPELVERVCRYIRAGSFIESAALGCGITRQTFYTWMRAGHAARDDRLAHNQRGAGAGEFLLTPEEERCVEFLDAMEEALSVAENRWVCGIVEAGERDWRAWAWRADRRTRLPHGYRACGEWDVGANESTLSGIRERQAARVEWTKKMRARVAAADAGAGAQNSEVIAETRKSGNAEAADAGAREGGKEKGEGEDAETGKHSELIAKARKSESAEGFEGQKDQGTKGPKADEKVAEKPAKLGKPVERPFGKTQGGSGAFLASVVLLLGLWLSPFDAGSALAQGSFAPFDKLRAGEPQEGGRGWGDSDGLLRSANESGFQPWGFGRRGSWAVAQAGMRPRRWRSRTRRHTRSEAVRSRTCRHGWGGARQIARGQSIRVGVAKR
jgi:hypothetical protein